VLKVVEINTVSRKCANLYISIVEDRRHTQKFQPKQTAMED